MILGKQVLCNIEILILPVIPEERKLMHAHSMFKLQVIPMMSSVIPMMSSVIPIICLLYTSPSPRDKRQSRMPSSA